MEKNDFDIANLNPESKAKKFMDLMVPNQKRIFGYILLMVPQHADAEDILQETMAIMWEKFEQYEPGTDFAAWGTTIAKYRIYNFRKKHKPLLQNEVIELIKVEASNFFDSIDEHLSTLKKCISELSHRDKKLLKMRYESDFTFEKIASRIDFTASGVYRALSRIHCKLVECLRRHRVKEGLA